MDKYFESDLINEVYDKLFDNRQSFNFTELFENAEVNSEFALIKLNDNFVLKLERM